MEKEICQTIINKETGKICGHEEGEHNDKFGCEVATDIGITESDKKCTCKKFEPQDSTEPEQINGTVNGTVKPKNHSQVSSCCQAEMKADHSGEGTFTMVCQKCKKDCNPILKTGTNANPLKGIKPTDFNLSDLKGLSNEDIVQNINVAIKRSEKLQKKIWKLSNKQNNLNKEYNRGFDNGMFQANEKFKEFIKRLKEEIKELEIEGEGYKIQGQEHYSKQSIQKSLDKAKKKLQSKIDKLSGGLGE